MGLHYISLWVPIHPLCSFNLGETFAGSGQCVGALSGEDVGLGDNVWLLGDRYVVSLCVLPSCEKSSPSFLCSFMKNVYTAFDVENERVGFAELA